MHRIITIASFVLFSIATLNAANPTPPPTVAPATQPAATKPVLKIIPGKVIVPTDAMRRIWGELVSMDLKTRTGTFRNETTEEVMPFIVMPYSELLHHAAFGDLDDFKITERAIFRMHQNSEGKWVWLTYIQDEMNMLNGHKEYFYVDKLDAAAGQVEYTQANFDRSFIRSKGNLLETDANTRYWKNGEPAKFADIHVGDKIRAKTHGVGKGKHHVAWEVFLDDASLLKFQAEQKAVHTKRLAAEGWPGYVDATGDTLSLSLFQEGGEWSNDLKKGKIVKVAPAGVDRKGGEAVEGTIVEAKPGRISTVTIKLKSQPKEAFVVTSLARLWIEK